MKHFPQIPDDQKDKFLLSIDNKPFAKYNKIEKSTGKQIGFLTEHSLLFILQGKKYLHFHDKTITIDTDHLVLLKKGIYTISEFVPEGGAFEALVVFIPEKFLKEFYFNTIDLKSSTKTDPQFAIITSNEILNSFKVQYLSYFGKSFKTLKQILDIKLQELFLILLSSKSKMKVLDFIHSSSNNKPLDLDFIIQKYLFHPITTGELANLSGRSLASFKRDFQMKYNASPKRWINQKRLSHAYILLQNTSKNVSEIAYECGFENVSHFIKMFRKEYSFTPNARRTERVII